MKTSIALMSIVFSSLSASVSHAASVTVTASVPVTHVYAPSGFDSNDNTEVVLKGYLPNLCYKAPNTHSQVNAQTIQIQAVALRSGPNVMCAQVAVPFLEPAQVGVLDKGDYGIVVNQSEPGFLTSSIRIVEATSTAVDDYVYANVSSVDRIPGTRTVILKGTNPVNCYALDQIRYISNGKDTYSVLPLMKQVSAACEAKPTPFAYQWNVPTELGAIEALPLLHVRVMNGKSVNTLFDETE